MVWFLLAFQVKTGQTNCIEILNDHCPLCVQFLISTPRDSALRLLCPEGQKAVLGCIVFKPCDPQQGTLPFSSSGSSCTGCEVLKPILQDYPNDYRRSHKSWCTVWTEMAFALNLNLNLFFLFSLHWLYYPVPRLYLLSLYKILSNPFSTALNSLLTCIVCWVFSLG